MSVPFATSDRLFDYGGPQPYGASPVCTPFADIWKELEWQKTQHALGRPVDLAALFSIVERADDEAQQAILDATDEHEEEVRKAEEAGRLMVEAIDTALEDIDKKVRTRMSEEILGRLNKIDRHDVASLVKELLPALAKIQEDLKRSKAHP